MPATWKPGPPTAGFQYFVRRPGNLFVLADRGFPNASNASQILFNRTDALQPLAKFSSAATGSIGGHPALRLKYQITYQSRSGRRH